MALVPRREDRPPLGEAWELQSKAACFTFFEVSPIGLNVPLQSLWEIPIRHFRCSSNPAFDRLAQKNQLISLFCVGTYPL
jgi:hypothetical protein